MKSSQLSHDEVILFIEKFQEDWCKVYYQDCHYELYHLTVNKFLKKLNHNQNVSKVYKNRYHSPIKIGNDLFSPTTNIKQSDCEYFNLLKIEERDPFYEELLDQKNLLKKAKDRYIEYIKRVIYDLQ